MRDIKSLVPSLPGLDVDPMSSERSSSCMSSHSSYQTPADGIKKEKELKSDIESSDSNY